MDPFNQTIIEPHKGQPIVITNMKSMSFIIISMMKVVCKRYFSNISTCLSLIWDHCRLDGITMRFILTSHRHDKSATW